MFGIIIVELFILRVLMVMLVSAESEDISLGTCYRISRNLNSGACGRIWKTDITKGQCCSNYSQHRTWSNNTKTNEMKHTHCQSCPHLCRKHTCEKDQKCMVRSRKAKCVCAIRCKLKHKPTVCGTDGRTYETECHLLRRACRKKRRISVAHDGPCETCSGVRCGKGKKCVLNEQLKPQCERCPLKCPVPIKLRKICAVDGVTYSSPCQLKLASCTAGYDIARAYKGTCKSDANCQNIKCWKGHFCHTDEFSKQPRCSSCSEMTNCQPDLRDLCASDGSTYHSICALRLEACRSRKALAVVPHNLCHENQTSVVSIIKNCLKILNQSKKYKRQRKRIRPENRKDRLIDLQSINNIPLQLVEVYQGEYSYQKKSYNLKLTNITDSDTVKAAMLNKIRKNRKKRIKECLHIVTGRLVFHHLSN